MNSIPLAWGWEDFKIRVYEIHSVISLKRQPCGNRSLGKHLGENNILESMKWNLLES